MTRRPTRTIAAVGLTLTVLAVVVGAILLALDDQQLPGELIAIGSGAAGALGGTLIPRDD
ncbi:MAG: hypothetical protein U5R31_02975 [Acidimicrobiia bacterium]|nr:hypothetical protein [Acidimicrobiia bacterium]